MAVKSLGSREIRSFHGALQVAIGQDWASKIAMTFQSDQASETYKWLTAAPALREWIGPRLAKGLSDNGFTIVNKIFEATLKFITDDIRRDKTDQIDVRIADLAGRYLKHYRKLITTLLINGTGSTSGLAYDGQYYFDDDHSEGDSGTQKNVLTASEVAALNISTATAPTSYEAANAILGVIAYMLAYKDDQGESMHDDAQEFLVMTAPCLMPSFKAACAMQTINTGSGTVDNPIVQSNDFKITHVTNPGLSAWTTQFCVFRVDAPTKPMIIQEEQGLSHQIIGAGSEYEKVNNAQIFGVKAIGNAGYGLWQHASRSTLS